MSKVPVKAKHHELGLQLTVLGERARAQLLADFEARVTDEANRSPSFRLYEAILARLRPLFPENSRDLEWDVLPSTLAGLAKELANVRALNKQHEHLASLWDPQVVGKLLGMRLGVTIHSNLEPAIRALLDDKEKLEEQVKALTESAAKSREDYARSVSAALQAAFHEPVVKERDKLLSALHQCYAATGEEVGDIHDFKAIVNHEVYAVEAVKRLRQELESAAATAGAPC